MNECIHLFGYTFIIYNVGVFACVRGDGGGGCGVDGGSFVSGRGHGGGSGRDGGERAYLFPRGKGDVLLC